MRPLDQAVALNILLNLNYMHVLQRQEALAAQQQGIAQVKPTTQLNLMPPAAAGFWLDFGRIAIFRDPLVAGRFS